ncbi:hypothetical protein [Actinomadura rifamycini]|uniref:hypothetical protein n=1 Tax=Actinomadura rifamycini TaxID=31962 RepID=UPI00047E4AF3|nr:hypothetical protein [Actinomadura rifamycini]
MVGKPPSRWFIGIVPVPVLCWLAATRFVQNGSEVRYYLALGAVLAVLTALVRAALALWPRMLGAPPGPWFTGAVAAVGVVVLASDWSLAVDTNIQVIVFLAGFVAVVGVIGRTALAFWLPRRDAKAWTLRTSVPALLTLAVMVVLGAFPPGEVRLDLSRHDLNEYAQTVGDDPGRCGEPRWVGLYKVTCAERDGDAVRLAIEEPLVPTYGKPWLVGPGYWNTEIQD